LRAIAIEVRQCDLIVVHKLTRVNLNRGIIADAAEFCILYPKVRFDELGSREEAKDGGVSGRQTT
jgi:hypothetical protein